jgi:hypothetical protein
VSKADPISPCTSVCVLDSASGYCRGCYRTTDEIAAWPRLSIDEKRRVLARLPAREANSRQTAPKPPLG